MPSDSILSQIQELLLRGRGAHRKGQLDQALHNYQRVLALQADQPDALTLSGLVLYRQQKIQAALQMIEAATQCAPGHLLSHASLAQIYQDLNRHKRAIVFFKRAIDLDGGNAKLWNGLALSLAGDHQRAAQQAFERAIQLNPDTVEAYNNLANLQRNMGQLQAAKRNYQHCLRLRPNFAEAHSNIGGVYHSQRQWTQAKRALSRALECRPGYAEAHNNLGAVLLDEGDHRQALQQFEKALSLAPRLDAAAVNAATTLHNLGLHHEARQYLDSLLEKDAGNVSLQWRRCVAELQMVYDSEQALQQSRQSYAQKLQTLAEGDSMDQPVPLLEILSMQPFLLPYQGFDDLPLQRLTGAFYTQQLCAYPPPRDIRSRKPGPLCVGIVSAFFYDHSNWKIPIQGWLQALNAQYEVYAYHTGVHEDKVTRQAQQQVHRFYFGQSAQQFAQQIRDDDLDILIYPEIGMHPLTTRLATERLARVQCVSWGHPQSSGLPSMDYFISSDWMEPGDAQTFYSEKLIRLPGLSFTWTQPEYNQTAAAVSRVDLGLPADRLIFLCVQNVSKYLPQHDALWLEIMRRLPEALLVFIAGPSAATKQLKTRLRRAMSEAGLDFEHQIVFLPRLDRDQYHALNRHADVCLDTPDWSGCNSSLEAFICDLPVVTLPGRFMRGRHTAALYRQMSYQELIARDEQHYIELAVRLGLDSSWRLQQSRLIAQFRHRLEGDPVPARALVDCLPRLAGFPAAPEPHPLRDR